MNAAAEILCIFGLSLVSLALWLVYPPLAIGAVGVGALGCGLVLHRRNVKDVSGTKEAERA